jgi:hypothetical protein
MTTFEQAKERGERGNDLVVLGKRIENKRIQLAFNLG